MDIHQMALQRPMLSQVNPDQSVLALRAPDDRECLLDGPPVIHRRQCRDWSGSGYLWRDRKDTAESTQQEGANSVHGMEW